MSLKVKLKRAIEKDANGCFDIIWNLRPEICSTQDVTVLLNIRKMKPNDPLAFLGLEADSWLRENIEILKKRFVNK